jgi:menaquinone-dependent protoporphyrinogen IX oxidase
MIETFFLCYVLTEMALNTVARVGLEGTVAYTDKVGHNSVTKGQSSRVEGLNSGTEGSTSVTEKQNSGTEGSKSTTQKHDIDTEVEKVNWKPDNRNLFSGSVNSYQDLSHMRVMMKRIELL